MIAKDPQFELRKAYFETLTNITSNGQPVEVFDEIVPSTAAFPAIVFMQQTGRNDGNKDRFIRDEIIDIHVITKFVSDTGGKKVANDIVNQIANKVLLGPSNFGISSHLTNWQVLNCEYQTNTLTSQLPTGWQVEIIVTFSQLLEQLN
jgi:energy-converting hydrogenase Eha subunit H